MQIRLVDNHLYPLRKTLRLRAIRCLRRAGPARSRESSLAARVFFRPDEPRRVGCAFLRPRAHWGRLVPPTARHAPQRRRRAGVYPPATRRAASPTSGIPDDVPHARRSHDARGAAHDDVRAPRARPTLGRASPRARRDALDRRRPRARGVLGRADRRAPAAGSPARASTPSRPAVARRRGCARATTAPRRPRPAPGRRPPPPRAPIRAPRRPRARLVVRPSLFYRVRPTLRAFGPLQDERGGARAPRILQARQGRHVPNRRRDPRGETRRRRVPPRGRAAIPRRAREELAHRASRRRRGGGRRRRRGQASRAPRTPPRDPRQTTRTRTLRRQRGDRRRRRRRREARKGRASRRDAREGKGRTRKKCRGRTWKKCRGRTWKRPRKNRRRRGRPRTDADVVVQRRQETFAVRARGDDARRRRDGAETPSNEPGRGSG